MSKRVVAISTGVSYLDKTKWCVKDLKIGYRKDSTPFWFVSGLGCNFSTAADAERVAMDIARNMKVPYIFNVKHGQCIRRYHIIALEKYGIIK